jgi:hypothetical protein
MSSFNHTYDPTCRLSRTVTFSGSEGEEDIPALKAQFFYSSPLSIDDPFTASPVPKGSDSKTVKYPPRPFSAHDNNALEKAWLGLMCARDQKSMNSLFKQPNKVRADKHGSTTIDVSSRSNKKLANDVVLDGCATHNRRCAACSPSAAGDARPEESGKKKFKSTASPISVVLPGAKLSREAESIGRQQIEGDTYQNVEVLGNSLGFCHDSTHPKMKVDMKVEQYSGSPKNLKESELCTAEEEFLKKASVTDAKTQSREKLVESRSKAQKKESESSKILKNELIEPMQGDATSDTLGYLKVKYGSSTHGVEPCIDKSFSNEHKSNEHRAVEMHKHSKDQRECEKYSAVAHADQGLGKLNAKAESYTFQTTGNLDTGTTGLHFQRAPCGEKAHLRAYSSSPCRENSDGTGLGDHLRGDSHSSQPDVPETLYVHRCKLNKNCDGLAEITVGLLRLHLVKFPDLQMQPIYWSPVNDIAVVTRATWFYKDTMCPVEPAVANQLETGYRQLRPWSQTWRDELNSAIEVGAAGEEKVSHRIWPKESKQNEDGKDGSDHTIPAANSCFAAGFAAMGSIDSLPHGTGLEATKRYPNSHVIYKDSVNAFILKPGLQPSEYFGRKPLAKIMKGTTVGEHVVRGFDWQTWAKLHPSKKSIRTRMAGGVAVLGDVGAGRTMCAACLEQEERPKVTDLILVIHGIGQKLSERVESFHFTHTMNTFRCSLNLEHYNLSNQNMLRKDAGGTMVLPVNWRSNLILDGGSVKSDDKSPDFNMKDITPDTIPAVRNVISDIVLDIPYYMSHHRSKMIQALVTEANRVYRLWCRNNPGFHMEGRVHIIAHSLGSVMALDVLSRQPTYPPYPEDGEMQTRHFEFDTKNVFFAGSPAGFFLLLEKGKLIPRRCRNKPEADHDDDNSKEICGEAGTYGCLAVDNIYNVVHYNDPIAYKLNATVDHQYAASLRNAQLSSASTGLLGIISSVVGSALGNPQASNSVSQITKPSTARLPSQLEMGVRNFSREKIAEKKFFLLNDNGQIDYFIGSCVGPLEMQYLNMLGAHSSYWYSPEFVRMLVTEVGRKPGKSNALPNMKTVKISHK